MNDLKPRPCAKSVKCIKGNNADINTFEVKQGNTLLTGITGILILLLVFLFMLTSLDQNTATELINFSTFSADVNNTVLPLLPMAFFLCAILVIAATKLKISMDIRIILFLCLSISMVLSPVNYGESNYWLQSLLNLLSSTNMLFFLFFIAPQIIIPIDKTRKGLFMGIFYGGTQLVLLLSPLVNSHIVKGLIFPGSSVILGLLWLIASIITFAFYPNSGDFITNNKQKSNCNKKIPFFLGIFALSTSVFSLLYINTDEITPLIWQSTSIQTTLSTISWVGRLILPISLGWWMDYGGIYKATTNSLLLAAGVVYFLIKGMENPYYFAAGTFLTGGISLLPFMLIPLLITNYIGEYGMGTILSKILWCIPLLYGIVILKKNALPTTIFEYHGFLIFILFFIGLSLICVLICRKHRINLIKNNKKTPSAND